MSKPKIQVSQLGFIREDKINSVLAGLSEYKFKKEPQGYYSVYTRKNPKFMGHLVFKRVRLGTYVVRDLTNNKIFQHKLCESIKRHGGGLD